MVFTLFYNAFYGSKFEVKKRELRDYNWALTKARTKRDDGEPVCQYGIFELIWQIWKSIDQDNDND